MVMIADAWVDWGKWLLLTRAYRPWQLRVNHELVTNNIKLLVHEWLDQELLRVSKKKIRNVLEGIRSSVVAR